MPTGNITDPLSLNYYTYSANNPIYYCDPSGNAWETVLDAVSLVESTASLLADPSIQNALFFTWDVVGTVLPFIPGSYLAKGVKWLGKADDAIDAVKAIDNTVDFADDIHDTQNAIEAAGDVVSKGWKIGDDISIPTRKGTPPTWPTVRQRLWKNEAINNPHIYEDTELYTKDSLSRMHQGLAPKHYGPDGNAYSMELHHKIPRRDGGPNTYDNLEILTPWEHAMKDEYRHFSFIKY